MSLSWIDFKAGESYLEVFVGNVCVIKCGTQVGMYYIYIGCFLGISCHNEPTLCLDAMRSFFFDFFQDNIQLMALPEYITYAKNSIFSVNILIIFNNINPF